MNHKRVLVTGSTRGLGAGIASSLEEEGYRVVRHGRGIREHTGQSEMLFFDVSDREASRKALEIDVEENGPFWGIVCNAGITSDSVFAGMSGEEWDAVINTNLNGFFNVVQPLLLPMIRLRQGGRIVVISSVAGITGNRGQVNYSASKAGLIGATKALALEVAKRKITVNCVAPGFIETELTEGLPREQLLSLIPMGRFGTVSEVGGIISFLFSEKAGYLTGQVISPNGGMV